MKFSRRIALAPTKPRLRKIRRMRNSVPPAVINLSAKKPGKHVDDGHGKERDGENAAHADG